MTILGDILPKGFRVHRQMFFNGFDQLLNIDWFGKKWMSVDVETSVRLSPRDECSEKNDRRMLEFRITPNLRRDFGSVSVGHDHIKKDQIRPKIPRGLMSPGRLVLFEDEIAACLFEKNFDQVSGVLVVINNQNPPDGIVD